MAASFYRQDGDGIVLYVRLTPRAARDAVEGPERKDDGQVHLKVRVRAIPDKGTANAALIALMARHFAVPKSSVTLVSGSTSRLKSVRIDASPDAAAAIAAKLNRER